MTRVLVDSNVLLDILTEDQNWFRWSSEQLERYAELGELCINPVIYAEISIGFDRIEDLEEVLSRDYFTYLDIPYEAAFLAGKCFLKYRKAGGAKSSPLPDFFIGAHAAIEKIPLISRDKNRFKTYFPKLKLITPE